MKKAIFLLVLFCNSYFCFSQDAELFRKDGHQSMLKSVSISPDGKYFVSVEADTLAIIWDMKTGEQVRTLKNVEAAKFRDNSSIYVAMNDKTFKLVDLIGQTISEFGAKETRFNLRQGYYSIFYKDVKRVFDPAQGLYIFGTNFFDINKGYIKQLPISRWHDDDGGDYAPQTKLLAITDSKTDTITIISTSTGQVVKRIRPEKSSDQRIRVKFSPDGSSILVTTRLSFQLIDIASGKIIRSQKTDQNGGEYGIFSPDGSTIALATKDYDKGIIGLTLMDVATGRIMMNHRQKPSSCAITDVRFSPDGSSVLLWVFEYDAAKKDDKESILQFDVKKGIKAWQFDYENLSTSTGGSVFAYSDDGKKILLGSRKQMLQLNATTGLMEKTFTSSYPGRTDGICFVKNNSRLVARTGDNILLWNLQTGEMEKTFRVPNFLSGASDADFVPNPENTRFFAIQNEKNSNSNKLVELDTSGRIVFTYNALQKQVLLQNTQLSFNGQYVLSQGWLEKDASKDTYNNDVAIFDTKTHQKVFSKTGVYSYAHFFNTKNILVLREKATPTLLKFYEMPTGNLLYTINVSVNYIVWSEFSIANDDHYMAVLGKEKETGDNAYQCIIDLSTKTVKKFPLNHSTLDIKPVGFTPGNRYCCWKASVSRYEVNFLFYDMETGQIDEQKTIKDMNNNWSWMDKISPDGKTLLRGVNGAIKMYDIEQKKMIGTIYPETESDNWAVVTPYGQFDGNAGAQNSMYHVSGNAVVPLSAMYEKFFTPRLLPRLLAGEKFGPSKVDINKIKRAPTVALKFKENTRNLEVDDDVTTIQTKTAEATITVIAECPQDLVTEIRLYQNGKLVSTTRNLTVEDDVSGEKKMTKTFAVNLIDGTNNFKAIAFNTERTESRPAELAVVLKPEKGNPGVDLGAGPQLHAVIIGINVYKNPKYNLNYAADDASAFKTAIEKGAKGIFSSVNTIFVKDADANKAGIQAALEKIKTISKPEDVFVFYYAGHGMVNDKNEFYIVPSDVTQLYGNDDALAQKGLSASVLQQFSKEIKAQKQLYILDACQSAGALEDIASTRGVAEEKAIAQLARSTGTHWLTASGSTQYASEFTQLGHGAFTYCLLEALKGASDNGDKKITVKELDAYLQSTVPEITQKFKGTAQYPASYGYGNDFPFIIVQ